MAITGHRRKSAKRAAIGVRKRASKQEKGLRRLLLLMILGGIGGALLLAGLAVAALNYGVPQAKRDAPDAESVALGHVTLEDLQGQPQACCRGGLELRPRCTVPKATSPHAAKTALP